jgi:hypothetical protein
MNYEPIFDLTLRYHIQQDSNSLKRRNFVKPLRNKGVIFTKIKYHKILLLQ